MHRLPGADGEPCKDLSALLDATEEVLLELMISN